MGSINHNLPPTSVSSPMPGTPSLEPTWLGYVSDTREALVLFEASVSGVLRRVVRRPHDRERANLIKSGSVFIYEESASGIKRWTDGVPWSPSRILNNFLIYRELEKPFPPGEKKRATKKVKRESRPGDPYPIPGSAEDGSGSNSPPTSMSHVSPQLSLADPSMLARPETGVERDAERLLVGSLTDSYQFKTGGLVKKTMSVRMEGIQYHLVSYYTPEHVKSGHLLRPSNDENLRKVVVRTELLHKQNFRAPLEEPVEDQSILRGGRDQSAYSGHPSNNFTGDSPASFPFSNHQYQASAPIPQTSSYYSPHPLPSPYQISQAQAQTPYMTTSRPPMSLPHYESYAHNQSPSASKTDFDHYSSYGDQRQFDPPRNMYSNQPMQQQIQPWPNHGM